MAKRTCGQCGETINRKIDECQCPGTSWCICEYEHHHIGCCGSDRFEPADPDNGWKHAPRRKSGPDVYEVEVILRKIEGVDHGTVEASAYTFKTKATAKSCYEDAIGAIGDFHDRGMI